jgi:hypothetical protein
LNPHAQETYDPRDLDTTQAENTQQNFYRSPSSPSQSQTEFSGGDGGDGGDGGGGGDGGAGLGGRGPSSVSAGELRRAAGGAGGGLGGVRRARRGGGAGGTGSGSALLSDSLSSAPIEWEWNDSGSGWKAYTPDVCRQLNLAAADGRMTAMITSGYGEER